MIDRLEYAKKNNLDSNFNINLGLYPMKIKNTIE